MQLIRKIRFTLSVLMMFVLMAAAAMALFVKIQQHVGPFLMGWTVDLPSLFLLAIGLTAVALGSWKEHSTVQIMLQITLACVGCLTLIWIAEAQYERAIRYWCQGMFAATVTIPMIARRSVKTGMARGPRRDWWKKTCEAVFFSFLTIMLVTAGGLLQGGVYTAASAVSAGNTPATVPTPVMPDPALQVPPPAPASQPPAPVAPAPVEGAGPS